MYHFKTYIYNYTKFINKTEYKVYIKKKCVIDLISVSLVEYHQVQCDFLEKLKSSSMMKILFGRCEVIYKIALFYLGLVCFFSNTLFGQGRVENK